MKHFLGMRNEGGHDTVEDEEQTCLALRDMGKDIDKYIHIEHKSRHGPLRKLLISRLDQTYNYEEMYVPSSPMTAASISQCELKDRELKQSQEEKAWIGKEGLIYRKQTKDRRVYLKGGRLLYDLETSIRRKIHVAMGFLG